MNAPHYHIGQDDRPLRTYPTLEGAQYGLSFEVESLTRQGCSMPGRIYNRGHEHSAYEATKQPNGRTVVCTPRRCHCGHDSVTFWIAGPCTDDHARES